MADNTPHSHSVSVVRKGWHTAIVAARVERCAAGDLLRSELDNLRVVLEPERPLLCLLGGAKVSDKLSVLEALAPHANVLAVGGAMAYTFLAARGEPVGASLVEPDRYEDARRVEAFPQLRQLDTGHAVELAA